MVAAHFISQGYETRQILGLLQIPSSSWYYQSTGGRQGPGPSTHTRTLDGRLLANQETDRQESKVRELFDLWKDKEHKYELEATGKLSGHRGVDTIARSIKFQAYEFEQKHRAEEARLDSLKKALSQELRMEQRDFRANFSQKGILNRIKALHVILSRDEVLMNAYLLLTAICLFLELSVILFKIVIPPSPYDKKNAKYQELVGKRLSS